MNTLMGTKQNMTSKYNELGRRMPVTLIMAEDNVVLSTGENSLQLGFGKKKRFKKPENAFVSAVGYAPRTVREVKITKSEEGKTYSKGDKVTVSIFEPGDIVKVTGTTKGRGFAGGVKRYNFHGGPKTHGQSDRHRAPGSIGQTTTPGRVFKGKRMAGHYGAANITITGLVVVDVNEEENSILVKGPVPGAKNGLLIVQKTGKMKNYSPLFVKKDKEEIKAEGKDVEGKEGQEDKEEVVITEVSNNSEDSDNQIVSEPENQKDKKSAADSSDSSEPSQPSEPSEKPLDDRSEAKKEQEDAK